MFSTCMEAMGADLADKGVGEALDGLRGHVGVDNLAVWVAPPDSTYFRPRAGGVRRLEGGITYRADPTRFSATRLKPTASLARTGDNLERSSKPAERQMGLSVVVSATRAGGLARRFPDAACKNVFGEVSPTTVCLANPDVRAWLGALVDDVTSRAEFASLHLRDVVVGAAAVEEDVAVAAPFAKRRFIQSALAVCFCESCRQRASVAGEDVEDMARRVRTYIERQMTRSDAVPEAHTESCPVWDWASREERDRVLAEVGQASRCPVLLEARSDVVTPPDASLAIGGHVAYAFQQQRAGWVTSLSDVLAEVRHRSELHLGLEAENFDLSDSTRLVSLLQSASEAGWDGAVIHHYGMLPQPTLEGLRRAIRFARRAGTA